MLLFLQNSYYVEHLRVATPEAAVHGIFCKITVLKMSKYPLKEFPDSLLSKHEVYRTDASHNISNVSDTHCNI